MFSAIMSIRGTQRERVFMEKSIPSVIDIKPDELLFGVDGGIDNELKEKIKKICVSKNFTKYRIIEVPFDDSWNFQLAHIIWTCLNECKHDKVYFCDVDTMIQKNVLLAHDIVGNNNVAVCSFTTKLLTNTIRSRIANFTYRLRVKLASPDEKLFSGCYWVFRPYYFYNIKKSEYKKIRNGIDTFMFQTIKANNIHNTVTRKEIGTHQMDMANGDYHWRQFADGIWWYANRELLYIKRKRKKEGLWKTLFVYNFRNLSIVKLINRILEIERDNKERRIPWKHLFRKGIKLSIGLFEQFLINISIGWYKLIRNDPYLGVLNFYGFKTGRPIIKNGYAWADKHKDNDIVKTASNISLIEWGYLGGKVLNDVDIKFERTDATGF